jgi:hypothetical protein
MIESFKKRKQLQQIKFGKLLNVQLIPNLEDDAPPKPIDISDEDGLTKAYEATNGLYQHYNKLFIAGTRDFPRDHWDDLKIPINQTLDGKRGRDAEAYYLSHHEIDTVIGHSLGGAIALNLEQKYGKKGDNPYGIIQSKVFGSATASLPGGGKVDRIRWFGDPISALDFNATTVIPSLSQRWNNSAHSFSGLSIPDKIPLHDTPKNPLTASGDDKEAEIITE